jgi:deoxyadenosine/deoxycytidine kinase
MSPSKYRYIAVDGPIGAGKTSLARRLAERLDGEPVLERPDDNPFLPRFYENMTRHALPTQLFFLFQRVTQLRELAQPGLFSGITVADFLLEKDPLFAQLTLAGDELSLYRQIYAALSPQAPRPDLVIYLHAEVDTLFERVRKRELDYEAPISREYLAALADAYARFFYHYTGAPLLVVNSEHLNFVDSHRDLELLVEHIAAMRGEREYFNVGG